ncbi:unnamed protein product [Paramecium octaurelia]|uniref:Uncharacterized protein n=1 Tax=Paramecium octaurelia TaxID=43137 RepID=A0A8S1TWM9_PAROT|nr:unnamed protein product [Paramecium octaurelia]
MNQNILEREGWGKFDQKFRNQLKIKSIQKENDGGRVKVKEVNDRVINLMISQE